MRFLKQFEFLVFFLAFAGVFLGSLSASAAPLSVTKTGTGTGLVVSNVCGIDCGSTCRCDVAPGTVVNVIANPDAGSLFGGWGGACPRSGGTFCSLTMSATGLNVSVSFMASTFPLTAVKSGNGGGTVTSTPAGIQCGSTCTGNFNANTSVTLVAAPNAASSFMTWSGVSCQGGNRAASCIFSMDGAKTATATFSTGHQLSVSRNGEGVVVSSPAGINCGGGGLCSAVFPGTAVTLTANPASGHRFSRWGNGASSCGTSPTCALTLNAPTGVLATFESGSGSSSCTGKDAGGATQTGACSTSATCSSGTALTEATGCSSGRACCYSAPPGSSCDMSKCSTTECTQGNNNSSCAAECKKHFGTSGEYYYCESTQGGSGNYCSGSENPGLVPCGRSCDNPLTPDDESAICTLCHLLLLIRNITDWIFMVMTYIAFAVLVAMGILYIISTGKPQLTGMAKNGIWAALSGFAIVLLGWVAVNVVLFVLVDGALGNDTAEFSIKTNGSWFEYSCDTQTKYTGTGGTGGGGTPPTGPSGPVTCSGCTVDGVAFNKSNEHAAIIQAGEHYKQSPCKLGYSDNQLGNKCCIGNQGGLIQTGACGISQVIPYWHMSTCGFSGNNKSASDQKAMCKKLSTDRNFDLACGYAAMNSFKGSSKCSGVKNLALCYNGGTGHNGCGDKGPSGECYGDRVEKFYNSCNK